MVKINVKQVHKNQCWGLRIGRINKHLQPQSTKQE